MTRFDYFMGTLLGVLTSALIITSVIISFYVAQWQPLGLIGSFLLFSSGALISAVITYYACKGRDTVSM